MEAARAMAASLMRALVAFASRIDGVTRSDGGVADAGDMERWRRPM
jgi:hypothetical protein